MKHLFVSLSLLFVLPVFSQEIVFTSAQTFSKEDMNSFYSSVAINADLVLFNANDFKLYAYRKDGTLAWETSINRKSNIPPFFVDNSIWVNGNENRNTYIRVLSRSDGTLKKTTSFEMWTTPMIRNGVLYSTGISKGGCVFAYDLRADSLIWERFIAHGISQKPYYQSGKIIANAEGDNWLELDYEGRLIDPQCEDSTVSFPSELKCVKTFDLLTHDGIPVSGKKAERLMANDAITRNSTSHTFFLQNDKLIILGNKLREKASIRLDAWFKDKEFDEYAIKSIIETNDEKIWLLLNNHVISYNHKAKKLETQLDLSNWEPHQVVIDEDRIWFISKKDGLLYAVRRG
ncbi:hypothetical protein LZZ85_01240 [Terrimonas sp. NA20]|uniref:PQQ-binding-like beta-propeller repeat protein n=1 Tax=Terrimonas ginsenosidimutans TaxID=2908004 RepID=A0ABS9KKN3_9BACT|nr:hypothetical protein [Terrimonas ginsenosidimutans]MCG2612875.1 hypothetical protein [Terrimonas ginsenosidimutans]